MLDLDCPYQMVLLPVPPCRAVTRTAGLQSETDLHNKVVEYIRSCYAHALIVPGLGEFQDSGWKRCSGWRKGYAAGQPDLLLLNHNHRYDGLCFEFKSPSGRGVFKSEQREWLERLALQNFLCFVSNSYAEITRQIDLYFRTCKILCPTCSEWLKVADSAAHTCESSQQAAELLSAPSHTTLQDLSTLSISSPAVQPRPVTFYLPRLPLCAPGAETQSCGNACDGVLT